MARKARFHLPGIPQHLIQRGNNREPCFYAEADYARYLTELAEAADRNTCCIHAYVLMTNHVHGLGAAARRLGLGAIGAYRPHRIRSRRFFFSHTSASPSSRPASAIQLSTEASSMSSPM